MAKIHVIKLNILFVTLLLLWSQIAGSDSVIKVPDSSGKTFTLDQSARRIISLAPHITELLFAVGAGQWVVGTVEFSDFPKKARLIKRIGNHQSQDLEQILSLNPDLILAWAGGNSASSIDKFRGMGIPVYLSTANSLEDIAVLLRRFALLTGVGDRGEEVAGHFERILNELRVKYSARPEVRVFYQVWDRPLMTINGKHYISDVIKLCGGKNIFSDARVLSPVVGREAVIEARPEVIFVNGTGKQSIAWLHDWRKWKQIPAVRNNQLYGIKPYTIARPTPRILMGAKKVCRILEKVRKNNRGKLPRLLNHAAKTVFPVK